MPHVKRVDEFAIGVRQKCERCAGAFFCVRDFVVRFEGRCDDVDSATLEFVDVLLELT